MKQPKKLTRAQRQFLNERGYSDVTNIRYCKEGKGTYIFQDIVKGTYIELAK